MEPEKQNKTKYQSLREQVPPQLIQLWEKEQKVIREKIVYNDDHQWDINTLQYACGVDLSANKHNPDIACVGLVVYDLKNKGIAYEDYEIVHISQPYIPGFLAFRQVPPLYQMFNRLKNNKPQVWPQLVMVDGNGILHTNKCGLACHLGALIDVPTLGVGKTLFYIDGLGKQKVKEICEQQIKKQNDYAFLKGDSGMIWGAGLRNGKNATNPVYVSTGTKVSLQTAIKCVILTSYHRVPEPIRLADKKSREIIESVGPNNDSSNYKKYDMIFTSDK